MYVYIYISHEIAMYERRMSCLKAMEWLDPGDEYLNVNGVATGYILIQQWLGCHWILNQKV